MKKHFLFTAIVTFAMTGCSEGEVKTVEYYQEHKQERAELLDKCKNDVSEEIKANCINATKAQAKDSISRRLNTSS
ncbi:MULTISPECIES: EexN family lipoprotein [Vibrio]|uniref:EexN family lipoprotein n=1 Tax=Vibrio parahaemolyticus TaxID=670 RepID=A0AA47JN26_VIBPH|nr:MULTISPECIES: EexN family lipoprotein [Vibrio]APX10002.1 hypothetical protein BWP24_27855 [Vibrio campbellii]ARR10438.1 hypothetical protein Vc3S01_p30096 [Vibrio campbellii]EGU6978440.1 EexN family lipoprotein [Vibrio parahaemolyticus]EIO2936180.1 EexN family lipoprotein [Vibrio parahaemolyticus]MCF6451278.1 EexN family lipoprotein [Vibrio sp. MMG023]